MGPCNLTAIGRAAVVVFATSTAADCSEDRE